MGADHDGDSASVERSFEALLRYSADPVMLTRPNGVILRANPAACRTLGRSEPELQKLGRAGLVVPDEQMDRLLRERAEHQTAKGLLQFRRADGTVFPAELTSTLLPLESGASVSLVIFRDVSEQRRLEQSLRESEERFRVAFQTLPDSVTLSDLETGRIVTANAGASRVTGWAQEELVGQTADGLRLWQEGDRAEFVERFKAEGSVSEHRARMRRKDGSEFEAALSARPIEVGGRTLMLIVTRDVTPQVTAERARDDFHQQLLHSQKLEAVGRLAGGVAHDFNNMLTVIMSCTAALREELTQGSATSLEDLNELQEAAERARDLTRQLLTFARRQVVNPVRLDLNEVVTGGQQLLRRVLGEDITLELAPQAKLGAIRCDRAQLELVIMNLAMNARDALPQGGRVRVSTAEVELDEAAAAPFLGAAPGRYVRLSVQDDGAGMAPGLRARAFEPFFTTKGEGKGAGLGLATVHGIVTQSGGFVRLLSEVGQGTRVEMLFPCLTPASQTPAPGEPVHPRLSGSETLLLVEDEEGVREVVARSLRRAGYRVLVAADGPEAVALAESREPIALMVCDVVMPEMDGRQVVEAVRHERPGLKALFVSGYSSDVIATRGLLDPGVELLGKPFAASALLDRIRALLDS